MEQNADDDGFETQLQDVQVILGPRMAPNDPNIAEKCLNIVFAQLLGKFWHVGPLYAYEIEK